MKKLSSFDFIEFCSKQEHQSLIDDFFLKSTSKKVIIPIQRFFFKLDSKIGERGINLLGGNEKDYHFYSNNFIAKKSIQELLNKIKENRVDNLKIPLLSKEGAEEIKKVLEELSKDFLFSINLSSISPIIDKTKFNKKTKSFLRQISSFEKRGFELKQINGFNPEVKKLHEKRWGQNRNNSFFDYLKYMNEKKISKSFGLFKNKKLVAYIQLILTGNTVHYYYSIFDQNFNGAGSAIINYAIKYFIENSKLKFFSFGRGAEEYKHRWKTGIVENYEIRGFLK